MNLIRKSLLACALFAVTTAFAVAQQNPRAALQEINAFRMKTINEARTAGSPLDLTALNSAVRERALEAVRGVSPEQVAAADALAWAQVFSLAGKHREVCLLCERFLETNPNDNERFQAQMLMLESCNALEEGHMLAMILPTVEPPNQNASQTLGMMTSNQFAATMIKTEGVDKTLAVLESVQRNLKFDEPQAWAREQAANAKRADASVDEQAMYERFLASANAMRENLASSLTERRANILADHGRRAEALVLLESFIKEAEAEGLSARSTKALHARMSMAGRPAPTLQVERGYGEFPGLEGLRGKVVMLDFFAHWCGPCIAAFPDMIEMYNDLKPKGLEIIGVTTYYGYYGRERAQTRDMPRDEEFAHMKSFIEQHKLPWPVVYGERENLTTYGVTGIPHLTVIDREGNVHSFKVGYSKASFAEFRAQIEKLLAEN